VCVCVCCVVVCTRGGYRGYRASPSTHPVLKQWPRRECQVQSWREGHKQICKANQAANQAHRDAGEPEEVAAYAKWIKMMIPLMTIAGISALYVPTSRIATHALMLTLGYVPSLPLQFKVRSFINDEPSLTVNLGSRKSGASTALL
jgi:hypothetical protein